MRNGDLPAIYRAPTAQRPIRTSRPAIERIADDAIQIPERTPPDVRSISGRFHETKILSCPAGAR